MKSTFAMSAQRQLEEHAGTQFKASSQLHAALTRDYKRNDNSSISRAPINQTSGKEFVKQAQLEKSIQQVQHQLASEVASLPKRLKPEFREQTRVLVETQKESRRDRHIKLQNEFERWVNRLTKNIDEAYKDIKRDIFEFFENSDKEINNYYDSLTDEALLKREIDFMDILKKTVSEHKQKRDSKISNLDQRLSDLEKERQRSLELFCNKLQDGLIDVAFQLEPEIKEFIQVYRVEFQELVKSKQEQNIIYVQDVNTRQATAFVTYQEIQIQKEQRWRDLKHQNYINLFNTEIQEFQYVYPDKRVQYYQQFKNAQSDIYNQRISQLEKLFQYEIGALTKTIVERWIEDTKQNNEVVSQTIDVCVNNLVNEQKESHQHCTERYEVLQKQLYYSAAKPEEELKQMLEEQFLTQINQLNKNTLDLLQSAIKFVEENDQQQVDVLNNYGLYFMKIATKNDEYKNEMQLMHHNYEVVKAQAADKNDDNIEDLNKELNQNKQLLKESLHHPKLEERLKICHDTLIKFQQEYERYHQENQEIASKHPGNIMQKHQQFEKNILQIFELGDQQGEQILQEKFRRIAEAKAKYTIAKEEYFKKIEEEKAIEEAKNKKGGKAPAPKAKDPKKFQQELEDRMKQLMKEVTGAQLEKYQSPLNQQFLYYKSTQEIVTKFYYNTDDLEVINQKEQQEKQEIEQYLAQQGIAKDPKAKPAAPPPIELPPYSPETDIPPQSIDYSKEPPINVLGKPVLEQETVIKISYLSKIIDDTKNKIFQYIQQSLQYQDQSGKEDDLQFLEKSKIDLQKRVDGIEPIKDDIYKSIYLVRAQQITLHKKKYERYAKKLIEEIDMQTEQMNFFLEGGLLDMKDYIKDVTALKQQLSQATTLAKLQGIQNTVKENYFKFGQKIYDTEQKLMILSNDKINQELDSNKAFMQDLIKKHMNNGGEYSQDEIDWYQQLLDEHNNTLNKNKQLRNQKLEELKKVLNQKRQDQLDKFEVEYAQAVEDLAAKDGTGKKYGKPKRIAQEKLRTEMTKCEKAQEAIAENIQKIRQYYDEYQIKNEGEYFEQLKPSLSIRVRKTLMALLVIMRRYALHIDALKPDNKVQDMPRVTMNENKFETLKIRNNLIRILRPWAHLYYSGEKKFQEAYLDIEKIIKEEAQKIYADKPKFLTGADKIPDYLRAYIENMQRNTVEFRIQAIRELRNSCEELSELSQKISEMVLQSSKLKCLFLLYKYNEEIWSQFKKEDQNQESIKKLHQKQLRPNLGNPQCKPELDELCSRENGRLNQYINSNK
ncbi:hypothetical protein pb186bvf_020726 [Paramecium bursaria]